MTVAAGTRPDLSAYNDSVMMPVPNLVGSLREMLGAKLVAYIAGVKETRAVRLWAEGVRDIAAAEDVERLRVAYRAARLVNERDGNSVTQAWFQGLNPFLEDRSPARVLREGEVESDGARVIAAARQFAAVG